MAFDKQIATFFGVGYTPVAPGTAGALIGGVIFYLLNLILSNCGLDYYNIQIILILIILTVMLIAVRSIKRLENTWEHDAQQIVIDEVVGVWIAMLFIPFTWLNYVLAFILFRIFDIVKPFFIKKLDELKSSWSIMLDDVVAGVYANLVLQLIIFLTD
jgi:phosphatidylglycerophosphatase A